MRTQLAWKSSEGRIKCTNASAVLVNPARQFDGARSAQRIGTRFVCESEDRDGLAGDVPQHFVELQPGPQFVSVVAGTHALQQRRLQILPIPDVDKEGNITSQRSTGERAPGAEIGARPDARFRFETALDLFRIRAGLLADAGNLVDESHRSRKECVQRVLRHFRRLDAHPLQLGAERTEQGGEAALGLIVTDAYDNALGLAENLQSFPQTQIFWSIGERHVAVRILGTKRLLHPGAEPDGNLGRRQDDRPFLEMREQRSNVRGHVLDIGAVLIVDRRIERDPDDIRLRDGGRQVRRERKAAG